MSRLITLAQFKSPIIGIGIEVWSRGDSPSNRQLPVASFQAGVFAKPASMPVYRFEATMSRLKPARKNPSNPPSSSLRSEQGGFEPPVPYGTTVFKTASFNHSDTAPINITRAGPGKLLTSHKYRQALAYRTRRSKNTTC